MLDSYAHEYDELVRNREAHLVEMDKIRNQNRHLAAQVYVSYVPITWTITDSVLSKNLEDTLAQLNTEHCEIVVCLLYEQLIAWPLNSVF